jgi:hypothetical protein
VDVVVYGISQRESDLKIIRTGSGSLREAQIVGNNQTNQDADVAVEEGGKIWILQK